MKNIFLVACAATALMLSACGTAENKATIVTADGKVVESINTKAQQTIFQAQGYYNAAVVAETAYGKLPRCPQAKPICSDVAVMKKVRLIDEAAWIAIKEAQKAARTPGFGDEKLTTYLTSAQSLVKAFRDITATLPAKK
jgi:hypothetical protein